MSSRSVQQPLDFMLPETRWELPAVFPDLSHARFIGFDVEAYDPNLKKKGPGGVRKDGRCVGVSLATEHGFAAYFPFAHDQGLNLSRETVVRYLNRQLNNPHQTKVGANILYDLEWLYVTGVTVTGPLYDVQVAEALIDENQHSFSLDSLAIKYLGDRKAEHALNEATKAFFGVKSDPKKELWRLPPEFVGQYAEVDAKHPIDIMMRQRPIIEQEKLERVLDIEHRLIPLLLRMRLNGVRVDIQRAEQVAEMLDAQQQEAQRDLDDFIGKKDVNVWSQEHLKRAFDDIGIEHPWTEKGAPSFPKEWLNDHPHPLCQKIIRVRSLDRSRKTYIEDVILNNAVGDRVYTQFIPLRRDEGGTVSGRLASRSPNLQQVPARDPVLAPLVRSCFIPEEGCYWECDDFSQIEPRVQVHYAHQLGCEGADRALSSYVNDPTTDFHQLTAEITGLERKPAKTINLALSYGMGLAKLANDLGRQLSEAKLIRQQYARHMPFLDQSQREVIKAAEYRGYVRTLLGRRRHFNLWVPREFNRSARPLRWEEAVKIHEPPLRRFNAHKAYNGLIQGSAADAMKVAMVLLWESGIYDVLPIMHLTVHDETDHSIPLDQRHLSREIRYIMEEKTREELGLTVPLRVDQETGENWGSVK